MKHPHQVHMLPTDKSHLAILYGDLTHTVSRIWEKSKGREPQHLYITSDEEIIDWMYHPSNPSIVQLSKMPKSTAEVAYRIHGGWRKVVATTNPELWEKAEPKFKGMSDGHEIWKNQIISEGIPKIPLSFTEEYVKRGGIKEVMLEMMEKTITCKQCKGSGRFTTYEDESSSTGKCPGCNGDGTLLKEPELKLTPSGEVIWKLPASREIYQREDMFKLAENIFTSFNAEQFNEIKMRQDHGIQKGKAFRMWFDNTYPPK